MSEVCTNCGEELNSDKWCCDDCFLLYGDAQTIQIAIPECHRVNALIKEQKQTIANLTAERDRWKKLYGDECQKRKQANPSVNK